MSEDQLRELAELLADTSTNIYRLCKSEFGLEADDDIFEDLAREHNLRKCIECSLWREFPLGDLCDECLAEQDD